MRRKEPGQQVEYIDVTPGVGTKGSVTLFLVLLCVLFSFGFLFIVFWECFNE